MTVVDELFRLPDGEAGDEPGNGMVSFFQEILVQYFAKVFQGVCPFTF